MPHQDPFQGLLKRFVLVALAAIVPYSAYAQDLSPSPPTPAHGAIPSAPTPTPTPAPTTGNRPSPAPQASPGAIDQLTQSNHELLDLLKKQQGVLEEIQYDRRLQSHQIENLEVRLTETLQQNAELQAKIAKLQTQLAAPPPSVPVATPSPGTTNLPAATPPAPPPAQPASYLPPPPSEASPGFQAWHRLFTLSGTDNQTSDPIHITGSSWRVVWHNQDKEGDMYKTRG